jgi:hypothetical protein
MPASFGSKNDAPTSFPINNINKGRWTQEEHKMFMQEYEKNGNNCMQIARVLSTQTPAKIKKHAECLFKQNLKTNYAAVKQYWESLSPDEKAQVLVIDSAAHQKQPPFPPPPQQRNNQLSIIIVFVTIDIIISIRHAAAANAPLLPLPPPGCRRISKRAAATAKIALPPSCRLRHQAGHRHRAAAAATSVNARQLLRYHCLQNKKM